MGHRKPDMFQKIHSEVLNRKSSYIEYLHDHLPLIYCNTGDECPLPYAQVEEYLRTGTDWMFYLLNNPAEYRRCDLSRLDETELTYLLMESPAFHCCIDWRNILPTEKRQILLALHPQWANTGEELKELSGPHWQKLLTVHPEYGFMAPWHKLSGDQWQKLLCERPDFARHCDFSKLSVENWEDLLEYQIRFLPLCPVRIREEFAVNAVERIFTLYPEVAAVWDG